MTNHTQLFQDMHVGTAHLLQQLDRTLLQNCFIINNLELQLKLTQNHIFLFQGPNLLIPTHYIQLEFALKFQTLYQTIPTEQIITSPLAIKLQRQNCPQQLTLHASHPSIIETWSLQLEKKINQRNFHKLFKAKKKIGKGAFATVYLAERLRDNKMVAVKAFSKQKQFSSQKGRQSLQNQIKIMRTLNHSNIMKLQGVYETQNSIYVILEYLQGQQLNQFLKSGQKLQLFQIREILLNILKGLNHLSKHRIIHRDLKPQNIMFKRNNSFEISIGDFGLATYAEQQKYIFVRCGTPGFVAPQIINIKDMKTKCDPISDIFSAGVIFHYLLLGCSVFGGKKYNEVLNQNRQCDFDFSNQIYNKLDERTFDLLRKMLEKDCKKRISAKDALKHTFFIEEMDIQMSDETIFHEITNNMQKEQKSLPRTPSSLGYHKQSKYNYDYSTKQNPKPFSFL